MTNAGQEVIICGWVQKSRDLGGMTFVDLRDRYGITQLVFNMETNKGLCEKARKLGREFVIQAKGKVRERSNKNLKMPTGEIEIEVGELNILNKSEIPPFTIEEETDGGEELRMKYRYLDLRRNPIKNNILLRHRVSQEVRKYMDSINTWIPLVLLRLKLLYLLNQHPKELVTSSYPQGCSPVLSMHSLSRPRL
jgi:Aspartyl-tRNA synthetase